MINSEPPEPSPAFTPAHHLIGSALIAVTDDQFCNGYTAGYLTYHVHYRNRTLSEQEIYEFIIRHMQDVTHTDRWNTGFVLGWAAKMHEKNERKGR